MSVIDFFRGIFNRATEKKTKEMEWLERLTSNAFSSSGIQVTQDVALQVSAVYQAVNVISNSIAVLPFPVYKKDGNGRVKYREHPAFDLLNNQFNEYMTAFDGKRIVMMNALLSEAGYIYIEMKNGMPTALYPIKSSRVTRKVNEKTLEPRYVIDFGPEGQQEVTYDRMIEIKGASFDGVDLLDSIRLLRNIVGLSKSAEDYAGEYFKNGIHPSGAFEHPGRLADDKFERLKADIAEKYSGLGNRHKALILEDGMQFKQIAAPPIQGQMLESRKFQVLEVARFFNLPPNKMMDYERATWNNVEEMNIQFVNDSLMPYLVALEQQVNMQLIWPADRAAGVYAEFNLEGLLRGKTSERYAAYAQARQWGWLNVNEIREKENMSNIGPQGDIYLTPGNMLDSRGIDTNGGEAS